MSTFKVGDRVRVYDSQWSCDATITHACDVYRGRKDHLTVDSDPDSDGKAHTFSIHPKQCRRLKKKEKPLSVEFEDIVVEDCFTSYGKLHQGRLSQFIGKRVRVTVTELK